MKRVLFVHFSQTGQLSSILDRMVEPLREAGTVIVDRLELKPQQPYRFPWPFLHFFDTFPETVHLDPAPLQAWSVDEGQPYDLIVLGVTVWFLAPSQPVTAFLQSEQGKRVLHNTPVLTVIACRNMWHNAYDTLRQLLREAGARHLDNVVLTDPASTLSSLVTTPRWMLTGRRNAFLGFAAAGIPDSLINRCRRFGLALRDALAVDQERGSGPLLSGLGAVQARPQLLVSERAAFRGFRVWGRLLRALGQPGSAVRRVGVVAYVIYLVTLIITLIPASLLLQALLRPLLHGWLGRQKARYELPSGSTNERCAQYE